MSKVQVSERALEYRVRRKLSKEGKLLCRVRPDSKWYQIYGPFYVIENSGIECHGCQLDNLATDIGVMKPYETLETNSCTC